MAAISLDDIANAYRRAQRSIVRGMEDAADFDDDARFAALERDQNIVDAAFFVLIFGQLEKRITDLAIHKAKRQNEKSALRDAKFEKRLEIALRDQPDLRREIEDWYSVRSDPAHCTGIASGYDIGAVLTRAREIDALLIALPR
jgi:hypothetical protein